MRWIPDSGLLVVGLLCAGVGARPNATEKSEPQDPFTLQGDALDKYCTSQFDAFEKTYPSTALATSRWTWYEGLGPTDSLGNVITVTSQSYFTSTFLYTQYAIRAYTPKAPCCSSCYLTAGTIDFYFWPDQATPTAPAIGQPTTSVNSEGFTFTSPSVYMAFSSLAASNACGVVGEIWTRTTIPFDASEITTARPVTTLSVVSSDTVESSTTYHVILDVITTQPPPRVMSFEDIGQNCSTIPGYVYWPDNPTNEGNAQYVHDPCHPVILFPSRLIEMQPAWASSKCGHPPGISGAYDPPRVLTPLLTATELATPTPKWHVETTTQSASPASNVFTGAPSTTVMPATTGVSALMQTDSDAAVASQEDSGAVESDRAQSSESTSMAGDMGAAILSGIGGGTGAVAASSASVTGANVINNGASASASASTSVTRTTNAQSQNTPGSISDAGSADGSKANMAAAIKITPATAGASVLGSPTEPFWATLMLPFALFFGLAL